jgi:thiosulfate/3-mercaptopyruvate sulfurtransferase
MGWEAWCEPAPPHAGPVLAPPGFWGVLAPADDVTLGQRLGALGLRDDRPMVVYGDGPGTRGREGRIAWMLAYFGASDVALFDGGWSAWVEAGAAVETGYALPTPGHFTVRLQQERRCILDDLRRARDVGNLPRLIDTRSAPEYAGEIQEYLPRRGHLPGAMLVPFADLFEPDGRYLQRERYLAMLPRLGAETPIVAYCEVGVRASLFAMLHEAHTDRTVRVYDGSLMEWALHPELPLDCSSRDA